MRFNSALINGCTCPVTGILIDLQCLPIHSMGVGQKTVFCLPLSSAPYLLCHWCHPSKNFKGQLVKESLRHASRETWFRFIRFSLGLPKLWSRGSSKGSSSKSLLKLQPPLQLGFKSILFSPGPAVVLYKMSRMHCSIKSSLKICSSFLIPVALYWGSTADKAPVRLQVPEWLACLGLKNFTWGSGRISKTFHLESESAPCSRSHSRATDCIPLCWATLNVWPGREVIIFCIW